MGRHLSKVILLVIAITIPGYISVEPPNNGEQPPPNPILPVTPPAPKTCSEISPKYKNASVAFFEAIQDVFTNAIKGNKQNVSKILSDKSEAYLIAAEECTNDTTLHKTWNHTAFIDLLAFAVENTTVLKDITKQGGCILNQTEKFQDCVNASAFKDSKKKYSGLFDLTKLKFNELTCGHAVSIKQCTVNVLQENCNSTVDYVSSLFDHMQGHCPKVPVSGSVRLTAFWVGFIVCVVEFTKRALEN